MKLQSDIERLKKCFRCQETDTMQMALNDNGTDIVYVGWCNKCQDPFSYRIRVDIVWDQEGRI